METDRTSIVEVTTLNDPLPVIEQIEKSQWHAGPYLAFMFKSGEFFKLCGPDAKIYALIEEGEVLSYCTYVRWDEIKPTDLYPWIGFVYTSPKHRGKGYMRKMVTFCEEKAKEDGYAEVYISTHHDCLYEHLGYSLFTILKNINGRDTRVYKKILK